MTALLFPFLSHLYFYQTPANSHHLQEAFQERCHPWSSPSFRNLQHHLHVPLALDTNTDALQIPTWLSPGTSHVMPLLSLDYGGHPVLRFFVWYHDTLSTAEQLEQQTLGIPGGNAEAPNVPRRGHVR